MAGDSYIPEPESSMDQALAQMELERERAKIEQQQANREEAKQEREDTETRWKAEEALAGALNTAYAYDDEQIKGRGFDQGLVDQYNLGGLYNSAVERTRQGISDMDVNPMASFNTSMLFDEALNTATGAYRSDMKNKINSLAGDGFEYSLFSDQSDDDILASILEGYKTDAQAQVDAARARGQLNDGGYSRALSRLNEQNEAAMADLQDLGLGVLTGYRDDLRSLRDRELDKIGQLSFDTAYDPNSFMSLLTGRQNDYQSRMRGDIFRAAEGQQFFDPSSIISGAGAVQGFFNPTGQTGGVGNTSNPLLDAFTQDEQKKQAQSTGTNGVF